MGKIQILTPAVADRIAAGEVVERPASIVRELLDNALDAEARRIDIDLESGGIDLVSVADDGLGMAPDDAVLAFERHATSKIKTGEDLEQVATLGFRGEALAAIAAVSRVELVSRPVSAAEGTLVVIDKGRLVLSEPASRSPGTTVMVRNLFIGIPARRKFLKGPGTELDHSLATIQRTALARWEIGFRVRQGGKELLSAPPAAEPGERIAAVLGSRRATALVAERGGSDGLKLAVWAGRADLHRPTRDGIHLFVNRRPVRDPLMLRSVFDVYRPILPGGRFPVAVIYLEIQPVDVDVNVHPAKAEVRFHRPQEVRSLILATLGQVLARREAIPFLGGPPPGPRAVSPLGGGANLPPSVPTGLPWLGSREREFRGSGDWSVADRQGTEGDRRLSPAQESWAPAAPGPARALAQFRDCYILAEDSQGLLVVDQHVAHERLLFEQLIRQAEQGPLLRQRLLFPEPVEIGPGGEELVERHRDLLERSGFQVEPFGAGTVVVREVPAVLGRGARAEHLLDLLPKLQDGDRLGVEGLFQHLLATVACHSAVRKGMALPLDKMNFILRGLASCAAPSHCPHGRVISLRVDLSALDKNFDRTP